MFEESSNIKPLDFQMIDITLKTSMGYRSAYPGRGLVEMDNVRSTTFPSLPVDVGNEALFSNIVDLHMKDTNKPLYVDPTYEVNGTQFINTTLMQQNRIGSKPLVSTRD